MTLIFAIKPKLGHLADAIKKYWIYATFIPTGICGLLILVYFSSAADMSVRFAAASEASAERKASLTALVPYSPENVFASKLVKPIEKKTITKRRINPLGLQLSGILKAEDPENSYAIIYASKYPSQVYGIGDWAPGDMEITEIHERKIVMKDKDGHQQKLYIPVSLLVSTHDISEAQKSSSQQKSALVTPKNARLLEIAADADPKVRQYQKQISKNPLALLSVFSVKMDLDDNNQLKGLIVEPGREKDLFKRLGFEKGDLITHVNNERLTRKTNGKKMIEQIADNETVLVRVARNNNLMDLKIRLR